MCDNGTMDEATADLRGRLSEAQGQPALRVAEAGKLVISWAYDADENTMQQAMRTARSPIVSGPLALMADAHFGMGASIGSVIPTEAGIIPASVGVDLGCGMSARRLRLTASDLPDDLGPVLSLIDEAIPAGLPRKGHHGRHQRTTAWHDRHLPEAADWLAANPPPDRSRIPKRTRSKIGRQLGTLGSGNHFVEVCLDEDDQVWTVLHSGSRGVGNQLAQLHIRRAKEVCADAGRPLEDKSLAYFLDGDDGYTDYIEDMLWAQRYAWMNRVVMMQRVIDAVSRGTNRPVEIAEKVDCHHNYAEREVHEGREMWITRKGAIRADLGDRGIIPGSMGTHTYIVTGLGSETSYKSAPHGAGRQMSRTQARRELDMAEFAEQMGGRAWQSDHAKRLIDEAPGAYKDVDRVVGAHRHQIRPDHKLHAVINYKGT